MTEDYGEYFHDQGDVYEVDPHRSSSEAGEKLKSVRTGEKEGVES